MYVAPPLLGVVASVQIVCVSLFHLTPWKGGGFGMFASLLYPTAGSVLPLRGGGFGMFASLLYP
ncbi:MAG: hypothetical protein ACK4RK_13935 [Gemmataceae bacterium]